MQSKYIYGPVPSRRLGFSLGIDIIPFKLCSFDCIYCQLGKTTNKTIERKKYSPSDEILQEVKDVLKMNGRVDYLTFSGSGEPTLHSGIGYLINELKKITQIPVTVFTNGSLLFRADVQKDLLRADVILPSLCAATQVVLEKINRSHPSLTIDAIIQGLITFRKRYNGKIWLEIMLVRGVNDSLVEITKLQEVVKKIEPDKIHLNTVVRPPGEEYASPLLIAELIKIKEYFGDKCEIIAEFKEKKEGLYSPNKEDQILNVIKRRPVTADDIYNVTSLHMNEILKYLDKLQKDKKIRLTEHKGSEYFEIP